MLSHSDDELTEAQISTLNAYNTKMRNKLRAELSIIQGMLVILFVTLIVCIVCIGTCYNSIDAMNAKMDKSVTTMSAAFAQHITDVGVGGFTPVIEKSLKRALASMARDVSTDEGRRLYDTFRRHGCNDFGVRVVNTTKRIEIKFFCDPTLDPVDEPRSIVM